ncbi:DUF4271 domain-containing protein [Chitinophaga silvisoli]|uniref:DUF4271 domain-containing protein n=1 Tax=Chitinophaga silvisoli TaxID=2291814 RepID=A0A3E1P563_9BACT|nr:DUF4271 domain-containing protein [Chitinophaga silvisoli]RFM35326.1 DUF4271 domain-containing protein [Chitinophaga silvisoli]
MAAQDSAAVSHTTPVTTESHVRKDTGIVQPVKKKVSVVKKDSLAPKVATNPPGSATPKPATVTPAATAINPAATAQKPVVAAPATLAATGADSLHTDTIPQAPAVPLHQETAYEKYLKTLTANNIFLKSDKPHRLDLNPIRIYRDLDWLVYVMGGVVLLLGIIRLSYLKYFTDLFRAFMNPTLSQRQLKDQLSQSPFPNFLLNTFFVISLAMYLYLLMYRQNYIPASNAWMVIPALIILVALVYSVKYVMLRFCGWLFGSTELADAYIFILYLINKVLGILLVPFLVILAFCTPELARAFLYISVFFIVILVAYRYIRSYSVVKQYLSFSRLHFFLYLCAFEVAPVLIITKVLLVWLTGGH